MTNLVERRSGRWAAAMARCPKQMSHGPCAGVSLDGGCEVPGFGECAFLAVPRDDWPYGATVDTRAKVDTRGPRALTGAAQAFLATAAARPVVVADLPAAALSAAALLAGAAELAGAADAVLLGDHGGARVQFPPSYRAKLLADAGHAVWVGINCRDRNRVALEGEVAACVDAGAVGVHCVTGDHTMVGSRPDAQPVFDIDCIDVVRLAHRDGALTSVAHAPSAPPLGQRLPRLLAKVAAGARVVFIDHCGGPDEVEHAVGMLRAAGFDGVVLACVPVITSVATAAIVESFAAGRLPAGYVSAILSAPDPLDAGVVAAAELSLRLLEIPGLNGVNLSGGGDPGDELASARALAAIAGLIVTAEPNPKEPAR